MPQPRDEHVRARMKAQKTSGTKPEVAVRRLLHRMGLRFRVNHRPVATVRTKADIVFTKSRVAVFVDGCFWHGCPEHFIPPINNAAWWAAKISSNADRDARNSTSLEEAGWTVLRYWEHEDSLIVASEVYQSVVNNGCRHVSH